MALVELLGNKLEGKSGASVDTASLVGDGRYVGLYFSAHWCPPCQTFTPRLAQFYRNFTKNNPGQLEIVFLSSDMSSDQCASYFADMPWLLMPYSDRAANGKLCQKFSIAGIPTLIIIDSVTGAVVCAKGREAVSVDPEGDEFPWKR